MHDSASHWHLPWQSFFVPRSPTFWRGTCTSSSFCHIRIVDVSSSSSYRCPPNHLHKAQLSTPISARPYGFRHRQKLLSHHDPGQPTSGECSTRSEHMASGGDNCELPTAMVCIVPSHWKGTSRRPQRAYREWPCQWCHGPCCLFLRAR